MKFYRSSQFFQNVLTPKECSLKYFDVEYSETEVVQDKIPTFPKLVQPVISLVFSTSVSGNFILQKLWSHP